MDITIKPVAIHSILAGLKLLESSCTERGNWVEARAAGKLHVELQKQVFEYQEMEEK